MKNDRRDFFKTIGTAAAGVAAISPLIRSQTASAAPAGASFNLFRQVLNLDGALVGPLRSFAGGEVIGEVFEEFDAGSQIFKKSIGNPFVSEMEMSCGAEIGDAFFKWVAAMLARKPLVQNGSVQSLDVNSNVRRQVDFNEAVLTSVTFPGVDGASKEAARMDVKVQPLKAREVLVTKGTVRLESVPKTRMWRQSDFRAVLSTVGAEASSRISSVRPMVVTQNAFFSEVPAVRGDMEIEPLRVGNIVFEVAEAFAQPFYDWHEKFVIAGNSGDESEGTFVLKYLAPNLKTVVFTLAFANVGIIRVSRGRTEEDRDGIRRVEVELYAETVQFFVGDKSI